MHKRRRGRSAGAAPGDKASASGAVVSAAQAVHAAFADKQAADAASRAIESLCDAVTPYPADTTRCAAAIRTVRELFGAWARSWLSKGQARLSGAALDAAAAFYTFVSGSYRLNVYSAVTDIDMVLVTTGAVPRRAVFTDFVRVLNTHPGVTQLQVLADIRVPLISATVHGQDLDIMTVHLRTNELPDNPPALLHDYIWMNGLDDASVLCMNGPRVTEFLLRQYCAPDVAGHTIEPGAFCTAVRYLRLWARQRGVYGNKHGYLGGVNIALLVAWVADLLRGTPAAGGSGVPALTAAHLVTGFFRVWAAWPLHTPIVLPGFGATAGPCPVWLARLDTDPETAPSAPLHVSAPCFPRSNTMFAATAHTAKILQQEVQRGVGEVLSARWAAAVAPLAREMLAGVHRWLQIVVHTPDTPQGRLWQGYIEAQIRHLVLYLSTEELGIAKFRALPVWVPLAPAADADGGSRQAMFVAADPDNVVRMYTIHGSVEHALQYFLRTHVNDPGVSCVRPKRATVTVAGPVNTTDIDDVTLAALAKTQCNAAALETAQAAEAEAEAAATAAAAAKASAAAKEAQEARAAAAAAAARPKPRLPPQVVLAAAPTPHPHVCAKPHTRTKLQLRGQPLPAPARVTAVRVLRCAQHWVVNCDVYVGPSVTLRGMLRPMACEIPALAPPANVAVMLATETTRGAYVAALECQLAAHGGALLAFIANKTLGCWCICAHTCHAHVIAEVATRMLRTAPAPTELGPCSPSPVRVRKQRRRRG